MDYVRACYVARGILNPPIEGHHVASKRIVEAAVLSGIEANVITTEQARRKKLGAPEKWTIVNSRIKPLVHISFLPSVFSALDDLLTSIDVALNVKFSECDIVHILNANKESYLLAHNLLRVKKPLLLHFYHSPYVLNDDIFLIRNIALRTGLYGRLFNNHALTVNIALWKFLVEKLGISSERVHYLPFPIDTDRFKPSKKKDNLREKHSLPVDRPIVAYVGSLSAARGIYDLIAAFQYVLIQFPKAILYVSHPQTENGFVSLKHVHELIRKFKLQNRVVVQGPLPWVEEIFNLADVVALPFTRPYWVDPPLVLLEAMATGATVITTSTGSIGEIVRDNENAILTKSGNSVALADGIIAALGNPKKSRRIGQRARSAIVQNCGYESFGKRLLEIYNSVLIGEN